MTEQEFLTKMKDDVLLTEADITMDMQLENLVEWDSLGLVGFQAMAKLATGKKIERERALSAKTIGDLYALLK